MCSPAHHPSPPSNTTRQPTYWGGIIDIKALLNAPTLLAQIYRRWSKPCSQSLLRLRGERPRLCPGRVREGRWVCGAQRAHPSPPQPTPAVCSPSPPKFRGSLCQGDISISPVSMATRPQVSAGWVREPARAAWGALPTGRPRCARTHGLGVPRCAEGGTHRTRSAWGWLQSAGHRWGAGRLCCGMCLWCGRCPRSEEWMWSGGVHRTRGDHSAWSG